MAVVGGHAHGPQVGRGAGDGVEAAADDRGRQGHGLPGRPVPVGGEGRALIAAHRPDVVGTERRETAQHGAAALRRREDRLPALGVPMQDGALGAERPGFGVGGHRDRGERADVGHAGLAPRGAIVVHDERMLLPEPRAARHVAARAHRPDVAGRLRGDRRQAVGRPRRGRAPRPSRRGRGARYDGLHVSGPRAAGRRSQQAAREAVVSGRPPIMSRPTARAATPTESAPAHASARRAGGRRNQGRRAVARRAERARSAAASSAQRTSCSRRSLR